MITAHFVLGERITPLALAGTALIIFGVSMAQRRPRAERSETPNDEKIIAAQRDNVSDKKLSLSTVQ